MQASLLLLVSLVVAVSCHPLLFHLEKNRPLSPDIICPDQKSQCMQGSTCCLLKPPVEGYGCCPQPEASCCEDGIHCCPHAYKCSNSNTCSKGDETIPATKRLLASTAAASASASNARRLIGDITCPDDHTQCPNTETCCLMSYDHYGCCPEPDAVCCADGIHCCPSGFTCDLSTGTCESLYGGSSIPMISKRPPTTATASAVVNAPPPIIKKQHQTVTANEPQNVMCNDKKTQCADGDTCCMLSPGKEYGCCPMTNATCCSDGVHCCPSKYTCNVSGQICSKGSITVPLVEKVQLGVHMAMAPQNNVICPNKETECSEGSTCCQLKSGQYACCPIADALCCSDGEHCCPKTYTCNTKDATCTKGSHVIAMFKKQPAIKKAKQLSTLPLEAPQNIICPDQESQCASNSTCCLLKSGVYGCCPLPFAMCCKDGLHCCPNDYACQEGTGKCTDRDSSMAAFKKRPALRRGEKSGALITPAKKATGEPESSLVSITDKSQVVPCSDGTSICPDGFTCCRNVSGGFGCCPHVSAVCCDDDKHCCPEDYTCDKSGSCLSLNGDSILPLSKKVPATTRASQKKLLAAVAHQNIISIPLLKLKKKQLLQYIRCPNGRFCLSTQSCCEFSCCNYLNGVCCSDNRHCCPAKAYCDTSGKCIHYSSSLPVMNKQPLRTTTATSASRPKVGTLLLSSIPLLKLKKKQLSQYITCPDDGECLSTETCCKLSWGDYGCCPHPFAECCSDDKHCCPAGTYCDLYSDKCIDYSSSLPVINKQPLRTTSPSTTAAVSVSRAKVGALLLSSNVIICPNQRDECSDSSTCCPMSSGGYGCCPIKNAICCNDGSHCCPQGYSCNTESDTCSMDSSIVSTFKRIDDLRRKTIGSEKLSSVICPDKKSECPSGSTCCQHPSDLRYGCCPLENATCCKDGEHCCPRDFNCDVASGQCIKGDEVILMFTKQPAIIKSDQATIKTLKSVMCPDKKSECPNQSTCCKLTSDKFACCPLENAICCTDGKHCCPSSYNCATDGTCTKGKDTAIRMLLTELLPQPQPPSPPPSPIISELQDYFPCPDQSTFYCSTGQTCCRNSKGVWECCNSPQAVCCSELNSCCPHGNMCPKDTNSNCIPDVTSRYPFLKRKSLAFRATKHFGGSVKTETLVPPSTVKQPTTTASFKTEPAFIPEAPQNVNVVCPDEKSECSGNTTCCLLKSRGYGCCPLPNALCCGDKVHCCPEGYECKTGEGNCIKGDKVIAMFKKQPAIIKKTQNIVCPDEQSECDDKSTCCLLGSGTYGCCPVINAQCCDDKVHCCPEGYQCKTDGSGACIKGNQIVPILKKQPAIAIIKKTQNIVCPDEQSECDDKSTCCLLGSGTYGCCPVTNAQCCDDKVHCCPSGYQCKTDGSGACIKGNQIVPMFKKQPAIIKKTQNIVCPDEESECDNKSTCCLLGSGTYGCCPVINATCCDDKVHCCPSGYQCKTDGSCVKGDRVVPLLKKQPAIAIIKKSQNVICPDGQSECDNNSTCCLLASGTYGCCPVPKAQCCDDKVHCCPEGFMCETGTCTKGDQVVAMLKKQPAILKRTTSLQRSSVVVCEDKSTCPDKSTCCKLKSGQYGCCPQQNGVCCSDGVHCCPTGFTCDLDKGTCTKGDRIVVPFLAKLAVATPKRVIKSDKIVTPSLVKLPVGTVELPEGVIKCPDNGYCPDTSTCCLLESGRYGCCPQVHATCCSDKEHCCPQNYTCQFKSNTCTKGSAVVPMLKKVPSFGSPQDAIVQKEEKEPLLISKSQTVICPDQRSECPTDNTCCLTAGVYRCCPGTDSVCCGDQIHCCPEGYTCHVSTRTCTKGDMVISMLKKSSSFLRSLDKLQDISKKLPLPSVHADSPENVICPDHESQCPDQNTCCQGDGSNYNCCPTPDAVCCPDNKHCCPNGYTCNEPNKSCDDVERGVAIPFMEVAGRAATKDDIVDMTHDVL